MSQICLPSHRTRKLHGFLYQSKEKNGRHRNRNAPKLSKNNTNIYNASVVVTQTDDIWGAGRRSHTLGPYERRLLAFLRGIDKTCDDFVELAKTSP